MPHQYCTSFPDIAQEKSRAKIEQKDKIVGNFFFWLFLFRLFDFDLIPKIENLEEENSEKKFRGFQAFRGFRGFDLPLSRFFNQVSQI